MKCIDVIKLTELYVRIRNLNVHELTYCTFSAINSGPILKEHRMVMIKLFSFISSQNLIIAEHERFFAVYLQW